MFCRNCGQVVPDNASTCPNCGQAVAAPQQTPPTVPVTNPPAYAEKPITIPPVSQPTYQPQPPVRRKKRHGCLISILVILVLIIGGVAGVYFLLPGLAKPVNLGVPASQQVYDSVLKKMSITQAQAPQSGAANDYKAVYGAVVPVKTSLTSEEVTSYLGYNRPSYAPWTNIQVKIGTQPALLTDGDGPVVRLAAGASAAPAGSVIEISATVDRDYILNDLLAGQYSQTEIQDALKKIGITSLIPAKVNLYLKLSGSIENNKVTGLKLYAASVMGVGIPAEYVTSTDASNIMTSIFNKLIANYNASSGAIFVSVKAENGALLLEGKLPSTLAYQASK